MSGRCKEMTKRQDVPVVLLLIYLQPQEGLHVVIVVVEVVVVTNYIYFVKRGRGLLQNIILVFSWNLHQTTA